MPRKVSYDAWKCNVIPAINSKNEERNQLEAFLGPVPKPGADNVAAKQMLETKIKVDGCSKELVMAVVLGAMLDEEIMSKVSTQSSSTNSRLEFNREYVLTNLLRGEGVRASSFHVGLVEARKNAKRALEDMVAGNKALAIKYAKNLTEFVDGNIYKFHPGHSREANVTTSVFTLYNSLMNEDIFKAHPISKKGEAAVKEHITVARYMDEADNLRKAMSEDTPEKDSEKRKTDLLNIMRGYTLRSISDRYSSKLFDSHVGETAKRVAGEYRTGEEFLRKHPASSFVKAEDMKYLAPNLNGGRGVEQMFMKVAIDYDAALLEDFSKKNVSYQATLLADPQLRQKYIERIDKLIMESDTYKRLVAEEYTDKIDDTVDRVFSDLDYVVKKEGRQNPDGTISPDILYKMEDIFLEGDVNASALAGFDLMGELKKINDNYEQGLVDKFKGYLNKTVTSNKTREAFIKFVNDNQLNISTENPVDELGNTKVGKDINPDIMGGPLYYRENPQGLMIISARTGADGNVVFDAAHVKCLELKGNPIQDYQIMERNADEAKRYVKEPNAYECIAKTQLDGYIEVTTGIVASLGQIEGEGAARNKEIYTKLLKNLKELKDGVEAQYNRDNNVNGEYPELSADDAKKIEKLYKDCYQTAKECTAATTVNNFTAGIMASLDEDFKLLADAKVFEGGTPLAQAIYDHKKGSVKLQNDFLFAPIDKKPKDDNFLDANKPNLEKALEQFEQRNFDYKTQGNGIIIKRDGKFLDSDGNVVTAAYNSRKMVEKWADLTRYLKERTVEYPEGGISAEEGDILTETLTSLKPSYNVASAENRLKRKDVSKKVYDRWKNAEIGSFLEEKIASNGKKMDKDLLPFIKCDGSEASRKWNKKLYELGSSTKTEDLKKAYKMALNDFVKTKPEMLDLSKDFISEKKAKELYDYIRRTKALDETAFWAKTYGVDLFTPKYDGLRSNLAAHQKLGKMWGDAIKLITHPTFELVSMSEIEKIDKSKLREAGAKLKQNGHEKLAFALETAANYRETLAQTGDAFKKKEGIDRAFKKAATVLKTDKSMDFGDQKLFDLRMRLAKNKKKNIFASNENSAEYDAVIDAIDEYRRASMYLKNEKRGDVLKACYDYLNANKAKNDRYRLIDEVREEAAELTMTTTGFKKEASSRIVDIMIAKYAKRLDKMSKQPNAPAKYKSMYDFVTNPQKNYKDMLMSSGVIDKVGRNPKLLYNKHTFAQTINEANRAILTKLNEKNQEPVEIAAENNNNLGLQ